MRATLNRTLFWSLTIAGLLSHVVLGDDAPELGEKAGGIRPTSSHENKELARALRQTIGLLRTQEGADPALLGQHLERLGVPPDLRTVSALRAGARRHLRQLVNEHMARRLEASSPPGSGSAGDRSRDGGWERGRSRVSLWLEAVSEEQELRNQARELDVGSFRGLFSLPQAARRRQQEVLAELEAFTPTQGWVDEPVARFLLVPHLGEDVSRLTEWLDDQSEQTNRKVWPLILMDPTLVDPSPILSSRGFRKNTHWIYPLLFSSSLVDTKTGFVEVVEAAPSPESLEAAVASSRRVRPPDYAIPFLTDVSVPVEHRETLARLLARCRGIRRLGREILALPQSADSSRIKVALLESSVRAAQSERLVTAADARALAENTDMPSAVREAAQTVLKHYAETGVPASRHKQPTRLERARRALVEVTESPARDRDLKRMAKIEASDVSQEIKESSKYSHALATWSWRKRVLGAELQLLFALIEDHATKHEGKPPPALDVLDIPAELDVKRFRYFPVRSTDNVHPYVILVMARDPLLFSQGTAVYVEEGDFSNPEKVYEMQISHVKELLRDGKGQATPFRASRQMRYVVPALYAVRGNGGVVAIAQSNAETLLKQNNKIRMQKGDPLISEDDVLKPLEGTDETIYTLGWPERVER